ncbi:MAG: hypothetical protein MJE66_06775 [Proteobacteria bacterium]|nr:hypothetical protein [Pseudomonadota bacterium]
MSPWVGLAYGVFALACAVVGIRFGLRGLRTGYAAELMLGYGFLSSGCIGFVLVVFPALIPALAPIAPKSITLGEALINSGEGVLLWFTLRVFGLRRRSTLWAAAVVWAGLAVGFVWLAWVSGGWFDQVSHPAYWIQAGARTTCFVWAGTEALRYHWMMQRRLWLGLADPIVADRFRLFAIFGLSAALMNVTMAVAWALRHWYGVAPPSIQVVASLLGLAAALCMSLAFFPPAAYARWIRGGGAAAA